MADKNNFMTLVHKYGAQPTQSGYDAIYERYLADCKAAEIAALRAPEAKTVAWVAVHKDHGVNLGTISRSSQAATAQIMMTGIAGNHGWSVEPLVLLLEQDDA